MRNFNVSAVIFALLMRSTFSAVADTTGEMSEHDYMRDVVDGIDEEIYNIQAPDPHDEHATFYSYYATDIEGNPVNLAKYKGMVSLVVNVASECGFTDGHYRALVSIQKSLGKSGKFTVLGFPSNNFGAQEPKENAEIEQYVKDEYDVNFPMFAKIDLHGDHTPYSWQYLMGQTDTIPTWNFFKYLVDHEGKVVKGWGPWTSVEELYMELKYAIDNAEASALHEEL